MEQTQTPVKRSKRSAISVDESEEAFSWAPEALRSHCEKYEPVTMEDPLAIPNPRLSFQKGVNVFSLCQKCAELGRNGTIVPVGEGVSGLVVPMCFGCAKANARVSQTVFFSSTIKSLIDSDKKKKSK